MPAQKKQIFRISCEQGQPEILALSLFKVSTWFSHSDVFSSSWERGDFPHFMLRPTRDLLLSLSISWDAHRVTKRQWKKLNSSRFLVRLLGYNMRFTFPWVFVENTPHLIWIKPEPHTHSLPPWPCNGWANVFSRHQKCISRRKKCIFFWIFPTLFSSFTVVVVGKSETCRLSVSISWDAFRKGWERLLTAWTHINISFLSPSQTCWLKKTEEFRPYNSLNICKSSVYMMPGAHNSNSSQGMKGMNSCRESGSWENLQESEER